MPNNRTNIPQPYEGLQFFHLVGVPGLGHGLHEQLAPLAVVLDVRSETPLVPHVAGVGAVLVLDHGLERVVALRRKKASGVVTSVDEKEIFGAETVHIPGCAPGTW